MSCGKAFNTLQVVVLDMYSVNVSGKLSYRLEMISCCDVVSINGIRSWSSQDEELKMLLNTVVYLCRSFHTVSYQSS